MARRKGIPPTPLTAEQVKTQIDLLDRNGQFNLLLLMLTDQSCHVGNLVRAFLGQLEYRRRVAELEAGVLPQPLPLPERKVPAKLAAKQEGRKSAGAARVAKHRAKRKREGFIRRTSAPVSVEAGPAPSVTK
jgi:hypothetical protein